MRIGFVGGVVAFSQRFVIPTLGVAFLALAPVTLAAATELLSEDVGGSASGGAALNRSLASNLDMSPDGRFVVFQSTATDLVEGVTDTNGIADVFLRDLKLDTTVILSVNAGGTALGINGNDAIRDIVFSPDSKSLVFRTQATNIVAGLADTNNQPDWFVRDLLSGTTTCLSVNSAGTSTGNSTSFSSHPPVFRPDGRAIAFLSIAGDLVAGVTDPSGRDLFLRNLDTATTSLVSITTGGAAAGGMSDDAPIFSADGRFLLFLTTSGPLDAENADANFASDLYARDLETQTTHLVSRTFDSKAAGASAPYEWTEDGASVVFTSQGSGVVSGVADTNGFNDIFLWKRETHAVEAVSVNAAGNATGDKTSRLFGMDPGSRYVAFGSASTNLTAESAGGDAKDDLYVRDTVAGETTYVSRNDGNSVLFGLVKFSPDEVHFLFATNAADQVDGVADANGDPDLFLYDMTTGGVAPVTVNYSGTAMANSTSVSMDDVVMSPNGRFVSFVSDAHDLVAGFTTTGTRDLFVRDLLAGTTELVTVFMTGGGAGYDQAATRDAEFMPDSRFLLLTTKSALEDGVTTPFNFNFSNNLYAYDTELHGRTLLSINAAGTAPAGSGAIPFELGVEPFSFLVNPDNRTVQFLSTAADMVTGTGDVPQTMDFFSGDLPAVLDPCGDPVFDPATPGAIKASDALYILKAGVGSNVCELCVCDVNSNGSITAGDALVTLKVAVGQGVVLVCPVCTS